MANSLEVFDHHSMIVVTYPTVTRVFDSNFDLYDEYCPYCYDHPHPARECE